MSRHSGRSSISSFATTSGRIAERDREDHVVEVHAATQHPGLDVVAVAEMGLEMSSRSTPASDASRSSGVLGKTGSPRTFVRGRSARCPSRVCTCRPRVMASTA